VLFAVDPPTFVDSFAVVHQVDSESFLFVLVVLAFVNLSIDPVIDTETMEFGVFPFSHVRLAVWPLVNSSFYLLVGYPVAFHYRPIRIFQNTPTNFQAVLELSFELHIGGFFFKNAKSMLIIFFELPHVSDLLLIQILVLNLHKLADSLSLVVIPLPLVIVAIDMSKHSET